MKLISSILNAAALFSCFAACAVVGEENYSLWPRRPAELAEARQLVQAQNLPEAADILQPYVQEKGIAGQEARQIVGKINVRRYLSADHPRAAVHVVKRGENLAHIAAKLSCPVETLILLNGIVEPASLKSGQRIIYIPMDLRVELRPRQRELYVWDDAVLVSVYHVVSMSGVSLEKNETLTVSERAGYIDGARLPQHSVQFLGSDRVIVLSNGLQIAADNRRDTACCILEQKDVNELALLVGVGSRVDVVTQEEKSAQPPQQESAGK